MIENIVEYLQNLTKRDIKPGVYTTLQFPDSLTILEILHAIGKKLGSLFSDTKITSTTTTTSGGDAEVQVTGDVNSLHFDFTIPAGCGGEGGSGDVTSAGNNRFTGKNTFVQSPVVPNPTNVGDAANKAYVDTEADAASADALGKAKKYTDGEVQLLDGNLSNEINALDGRVETLEDSVTQIETKQATDEQNIQTNANDIVQLSENQASLQESVQQLQNGTLHKMASTGTVGQYWRKSKTGDAGEWQDGDGGGGGSTSTLAWLPDVDVDGNLSWTQSTTTTPPETRNIKGADGTPGERGPQGLSGADGYSPKATVTPTLTGATISITDKDGTTTANITNGADGTPGAPGETGPQGPSGVGVPKGGTTGQVLAKKSATDYDTEWVQPTSGSGGNVPTPPAYADRYLRTKDAEGNMEWGSLPKSTTSNANKPSLNTIDFNATIRCYDSDGVHYGETSNVKVQLLSTSSAMLSRSEVTGAMILRFTSYAGTITTDSHSTTYAGGYLTIYYSVTVLQDAVGAELYNGDEKVSDAEIVIDSNDYTHGYVRFKTPTSFSLTNAKIKLKTPVIYYNFITY